MNIAGITWRGESIDDVEILHDLVPALVHLLSSKNGFILHKGALHVRGASRTPLWHSLCAAWRGPTSIHTLYQNVRATDVPFAQDQVGDQFLIRDAAVLRLSAETGEVEQLADNLEIFFQRVNEDIEGFLNVGLAHTMQPGELLLAYPPFVFRESGTRLSLRPVPAEEAIQFHADLARQLRDVPDGGQVEFKI
jgi:hypothetical protein